MTNPAGAAVAAPLSMPRQTAGYMALIGVTFITALILSCWLLGRCLPFPAVPVVREKIEHLARHGDDYDVVFIGSSRVYFQVLPAIFDEVAREEGISLRSFNAAIPAMAPPEDNYVLDQILRRPHQRLRWVVFEAMSLGSGKGDPILSGTGRDTYWHDGARTWLLTRRFFEDCAVGRETRDWYDIHRPASAFHFGRALRVWLENLGLFAENCSHIGRGGIWIMRAFGPLKKSKEDLPKNGETWDGWAFPKIAKSLTGERLANYQRDHAELLEMKDRFDAGDAASWNTLRAKMIRLREEQITPILFLPPKVGTRPYRPAQLQDQPLSVLDFSDPREYPELFALDHRLDGEHLNYDGADLFTRLLARKFLETLKAGGHVP